MSFNVSYQTAEVQSPKLDIPLLALIDVTTCYLSARYILQYSLNMIFICEFPLKQYYLHILIQSRDTSQFEVYSRWNPTEFDPI